MDLKNIRVDMQLYSSEQKMYDDNKIEPALKRLENYTYEKDFILINNNFNHE